MKIMTINTHSLVEKDYENKLIRFIAFVLNEQPDVIAMQEVNQSIDSPQADTLPGYVPCEQIQVPIREDNHALQVVKRLGEVGLHYQWTWVSGKIGYDKYDEGMAILSRSDSIEHAESFYISKSDDYSNWKSRCVLGARIGGNYYYTVHMGWWNDAEEPFHYQWSILNQKLSRYDEKVWLMGDFNNPAELPDQGYDMIHRSGWYDTYLLAGNKDNGITVEEEIDGWRDQLENPSVCGNGMRIDQIWCSKKVPVISSKVVCNGISGEVVSDHFGVMITF